MIEIRELTKRYGDTLAVDGLSFHVRPGCVTGFLGPNGAGKSTTMRTILGLDAPTSGAALVNGKRYADITRPMTEVGSLLDAGAVHGGRSAFNHLYCLARSNGIGKTRVRAVLERVGLSGVANKRVGGFSLGMKQRLGIATALLGDPGTFLFDEPINGLDPEGIRWIRDLMRSLSVEGRTVLVSSHLMSEMAVTADHIVVIGRGKLITEASIADLNARFQRDVLVRTPHGPELAHALEAKGATVQREPDGRLAVGGLDAEAIGGIALAARLAVHELTPRSDTLEDAYLKLTNDSTEYRAERVAP
ncbi:ATP-binding cassette domain-containing protein [Actinokineospora diospyrosa]|uniref:ABC-2 type transport system ATP-binding protein n=1 Tax=Actinokineospora diospyrosa TaxID=103728 RepID=A0ABT1IC11_9PSEU|nr:ATP-binding cassette domain-containing protein [Actinokineospora diospyrosa]MCP2270167.1 ABC-2 type transport system ATP-binding protein [Actinokineospora diospyrosa]